MIALALLATTAAIAISVPASGDVKGIDAAVEVPPFQGLHQQWFFRADEYVQYETKVGAQGKERVVSGPSSISVGWAALPDGWYGGIDAAARATRYFNNDIWLFKGDEYVRYSPGSTKLALGPKKISDGWPGLPPEFTGGIDAVLEVPAAGYMPHQLWFFKDDEYLRYDTWNGKVVTGPSKIATGWSDLPVAFTEGIDAAVIAPSNGQSQFWLFKDDQYVLYDITGGKDTLLEGPAKVSEGRPAFPWQLG